MHMQEQVIPRCLTFIGNLNNVMYIKIKFWYIFLGRITQNARRVMFRGQCVCLLDITVSCAEMAKLLHECHLGRGLGWACGEMNIPGEGSISSGVIPMRCGLSSKFSDHLLYLHTYTTWVVFHQAAAYLPSASEP